MKLEDYLYYTSSTGLGKIYHGNCLNVLSLLDNSVDSIITDPPYGISFMGKKWDYDIPSIEVWQECLRVLKPGGHILVACGTRTQHRMATNIEDAGFEIRDIISWIYGSGFPKSHNIGKLIDKMQGNVRQVIKKVYADGTKPRKTSKYVLAGKQLSKTSGINNIETKGTSEWEGWGTALKPAQELWTLARKPLSEKTVVENVLKWGTGGINIDESRVEGKPRLTGTLSKGEEIKAKPTSFKGSGTRKLQTGYDKKMLKSNLGRFPANLIHDGSEEVVSGFPVSNSPKSYIRKLNGFSSGNSGLKKIGEKKGKKSLNFGDSGSASRFFYCAKASKSERNAGLDGFEKGNHHPTVKPVKLMIYLIRLITPKNGIVLDPYTGSGTTGIACEQLNRRYILIEQEEKYCEIIKQRIHNETRQLKLF